MARFKVGDKVRVINNGSRYDTYTDWFEKKIVYGLKQSGWLNIVITIMMI